MPASARELLRRPDFRRLFVAVSISELGDSLHYIALMWLALVAGGPLGVVAVRLADSVPALVFGVHGSLAADRFDRRRLMVGADLVRAAVLVPLAVAGLSGHLPLIGLVAAAFLIEAATSYFAPAYGAAVPALVDRENVQAANGLIAASANALSIGGWALAALLLSVLPMSVFFALNSASFLVSALLIARISGARGRPLHGERPHVREGLDALRPHRMLTAAVAVLGVAATISAGTWIGGVPQLIRSSLGLGAGSFSAVMVGYAVGAIAAGAVLARRPVRRKARASMLAWSLYLPAYALIAWAGSLPLVVVGAAVAGIGNSSAVVLVNAAAQEQIPDRLLGRVSGLISLTHRGAHATGLLLVAPWFAVVPARSVFAAAALALPAVALAGVAIASRGAAARAPATGRSR
jgi:Transmembrane secretion effector